MEYENEKLKEFNQYLSGRKVAVIGLGVSNLPLIDYLYELKAQVTVFDRTEVKDLDRKIVRKITNYGMGMSFGENYLEELVGFDLIFRSPSCLPTNPYLVAEAQRGAIITTEIEMVIELCPCKIIGVTGSDGKTTTTTLISEILKAKEYHVFLGGNIGTPLFTKIGEMTPEDIVVLELSSFQLMDMKISPDVAVITNITPNHLDKHESMEEYIEAKKNIFKYQDENGLLVLNYDNEITKSFEQEAPGNVMFFSSKSKLPNGYIVDDNKIKYCENGLRSHILDTKEMKIRGVHNFENVAAALIATRDLVDSQTACETILKFKGVEHRLELVVQTKDRIKWYNDSVSSSPTRTMAGLNAFNLRNIILIAGGYDKPIVENYKELILLGATSGKIEKAVKQELKNQDKKMKIHKCTDLRETVEVAKSIAVQGDIVLFSPASASFDLFKNFAERGKMFKKYVKEIV